MIQLEDEITLSDILHHIPEVLGGVIGALLRTAQMFLHGIVIFGPAVGQTIARFTMTAFRSAIVTMGIFTIFNFLLGGPAYLPLLVAHSVMNGSFSHLPTMIRYSLRFLFASAWANFEWNTRLPNYEPFVLGLFTALAPFAALTFSITRTVLLGLGVLQRNPANGRARYIFESAEYAQARLDEATRLLGVALHDIWHNGALPGTSTARQIKGETADALNAAHTAIAQQFQQAPGQIKNMFAASFAGMYSIFITRPKIALQGLFRKNKVPTELPAAQSLDNEDTITADKLEGEEEKLSPPQAIIHQYAQTTTQVSLDAPQPSEGPVAAQKNHSPAPQLS